MFVSYFSKPAAVCGAFALVCAAVVLVLPPLAGEQVLRAAGPAEVRPFSLQKGRAALCRRHQQFLLFGWRRRRPRRDASLSAHRATSPTFLRPGLRHRPMAATSPEAVQMSQSCHRTFTHSGCRSERHRTESLGLVTVRANIDRPSAVPAKILVIARVGEGTCHQKSLARDHSLSQNLDEMSVRPSPQQGSPLMPGRL